MTEVVVSERAAEWLRDAEPDVRDRIVGKLEDITDFPDHYLKRLKPPLNRLRKRRFATELYRARMEAIGESV